MKTGKRMKEATSAASKEIAGKLFSGTLHFVSLSFPNGPSIPISDLKISIQYLVRAAPLISRYCSAYGNNSLEVSQTPLSYSPNVKNYDDATLERWADNIAQQNSITSSDCLVFLNPKGAVNSDADASKGVLGYHNITPSGLPYCFVNIMGTDLTLDDASDLYAVALSHEVAEMCLVGDTKIPLLDGTEVEIKDLVGRDHFWVYSCKENGELRPGRGRSARLTHSNADVVRVILDNGRSIVCTPDHKFLMRDGTYARACQFTSGDSLMPLYRQNEILDKKLKGINVYEKIYSPNSNDWIWTDRMVVPTCLEGYVRHHIDFNRSNNSPENLKVIPWEDHHRLHADHTKQVAAKGTNRALSLEGLQIQQGNVRRHMKPDAIKNGNASTAGLKSLEIEGSTSLNHKVVAVEPAGKADVYDITVDNYHDFALSSGVFVHNCVDPLANQKNPEVSDECAGNCQVDYRNFFDSKSNWIPESQSSAFPPNFPYAFFTEGVVLPPDAKECPAPAKSCQYPPPAS